MSFKVVPVKIQHSKTPPKTLKNYLENPPPSPGADRVKTSQQKAISHMQ